MPRRSPRRSRRPAARASQRSSRNFRWPSLRDSTTCVMSSPIVCAVVEAQLEDQLARRVPRRIAGHHEARGARIAQQRKRALHVGAREAEMDGQPLLPAVAFEPQRQLLDRLRRMRDPAPAEECASRWSRAGRFRTGVPALWARSWSHQQWVLPLASCNAARGRRWHWGGAWGEDARDVGRADILAEERGWWPRVELRLHEREGPPRARIPGSAKVIP